MKRKIFKSILCSLLIIALVSAPMSALAASKVAYILKVNGGSAGKVYVRSGSSLKGGNGSSGIIGTLKNGTRVLYWGQKSGQMLRVMTNSGAVGYIYKGNLKAYGAMSKKQVYLTNGSTALYKRSGSSMKRSGTLGKNKPLLVYRISGGWALVKNLAGKTAYVKMSSLKKAF